MKTFHFSPARFAASVAVAVAALVSACAIDTPSSTLLAPGEAQKEIVNPPQTLPALTRDVALPNDIVVTQKINQAGGTIAIPEAGLKVTVPAGAVKRPTNFTVRARAGVIVAYDFGPEHSTFSVPLEVKQSLKGTSWWKMQGKLSGAYYADASQLDYSTNRGTINEKLDTYVDVSSAFAKFNVVHFSGYMLCSE